MNLKKIKDVKTNEVPQSGDLGAIIRGQKLFMAQGDDFDTATDKALSNLSLIKEALRNKMSDEDILGAISEGKKTFKDPLYYTRSGKSARTYWSWCAKPFALYYTTLVQETRDGDLYYLKVMNYKPWIPEQKKLVEEDPDIINAEWSRRSVVLTVSAETIERWNSDEVFHNMDQRNRDYREWEKDHPEFRYTR